MIETAYGLTIQPTGDPELPHWRVKVLRHLTPDQNRGKHNLYVDVVDETGQRVEDTRLRIAWLTHDGDQLPDFTRLDKPDTDMELGDGSVDLYPSQTLTAWIAGDDLPSARVVGIHTRHPDEAGPHGELWNSYGHHSFYVCFERLTSRLLPPVIPPPVGGLEARVARLERAMRAMSAAWG